MIEFFQNLVRNHGWHFIGELAALALVTVFTAFYVHALVRGKVAAAHCPACGRITSKARPSCPRCGAALGET